METTAWTHLPEETPINQILVQLNKNFGDKCLELMSKVLNHLANILQVYAGGLIFMKYYYFSKRKPKYFYNFNNFYSEKSWPPICQNKRAITPKWINS